jgi:hypothetical protein
MYRRENYENDDKKMCFTQLDSLMQGFDAFAFLFY